MDAEAIRDLFAGLGEVSIRRMFGGKGVYFYGLIVGVDLYGEVMLKADDISAPDFAGAGAVQWVYENKKGTPVKMPYWSIPDSALDDPDELTIWTRKAFEAARRSVK
ncbi:TfoX/Sxy family protein [Corticibacterium sp. UT-5YL-CI-8]|nr:TfoX/Sxy family protein [Tianweitania sp. UT-5YL-CI-8]